MQKNFFYSSTLFEYHIVKIGQLGFATPVINNEKLDREILCRITSTNDDKSKVKVKFLTKYAVMGKQRINLHESNTWFESNKQFRPQKYYMKPEICVPKQTKYKDIREWILKVDDNIASNPAMLGLPPRAELLILAKRAGILCQNLLALQDVEADGELEELNQLLSNTGDEQSAFAVPQWMKDLSKSSSKWLEMIPGKLSPLQEKKDSIKNPLFRFVRREVIIGTKVLKAVTRGLTDLIQFVDGEIKATNELRKMVASLSKEIVPKNWNRYRVASLGVQQWIIDLAKRLEQLEKIILNNYVENPFNDMLWLGGIFSPEGFVAATRQYIASKNKWPLESLVLTLQVGQSNNNDNAFLFEGLTLYGAGWSNKDKCLVLTEKTSSPLPVSRFIWKDGTTMKDSNKWIGKAPDIKNVYIPVYLNASFKQLLFSVQLPVYSYLPDEVWLQRAVSIAVWQN